jgi:chromosome segregation ATPase
MDSSTVIWIVVAVVAVLVVLAVAMLLGRKASERKTERNRARAGELREQAAATQEGIRRHQAEADEVEARAREARAEADRKRAEAQQLEADAKEKKAVLHEHVERRDEVLQQADEIDPDTRVDDGGPAEDAAEDTADAPRHQR